MKNNYSKAITFFAGSYLLLFSFTLQAQETIRADSAAVFADTSVVDFADMSLESLMDMEVSVGSKVKESIRETASIISVITAEDIKVMGARDLTDILRTVPGFELGSDVSGAVGASMRGIWAYEGKMLIMLDGMPYNDLTYGTPIIGNRVNINQIEKIEIIRGPGSAVHGGWAEMAVVNIVTYAGSSDKGFTGSYTVGMFGDGLSRTNLSLGYYKKITNDLSASVSVYHGNSLRSNRQYTEWDGNTYNSKLTSNRSINNINIGIQYKNLEYRMIYDDYSNQSNTDTALYNPGNPQLISNTRQRIFYNEVKGKFKLGEKLILMPSVSLNSQAPWQANSLNDSIIGFYVDQRALRSLANLTAVYTPHENVNIQLGGEVYNDQARTVSDVPTSQFVNYVNNNVELTNTFSMTIVSVFGQVLLKTKLANFTVGARYQYSTLFPSALVPRFGITKAFNKFHVKALYSMAFRSPNINNYTLGNNNIEPELTQVLEAELGYKLSNEISITGSVFNILIEKPIAYEAGSANLGLGSYVNGNKIGTRGVEAEFKLKKERYFATVNYSYFTAFDNETPNYQVYSAAQGIDEPGMTIGMPNHKAVVIVGGKVYKSISLNTSLIYTSERYGAYTPAGSQVYLFKKYDPTYTWNANLVFNDLFNDKLSLVLSCMNILDTNYDFIQAYQNVSDPSINKNPLTGTPREFLATMRYNF